MEIHYNADFLLYSQIHNGGTIKDFFQLFCVCVCCVCLPQTFILLHCAQLLLSVLSMQSNKRLVVAAS